MPLVVMVQYSMEISVKCQLGRTGGMQAGNETKLQIP